MANNVIKRKWNMNSMVQIEDLTGMTFQDEAAGHTFEISAIDDAGNAVALSGTPAGVFLRPDNTDQALTCSVSDGKVYATLPAGCYDIPGRFGLTIFLTSNSQTAAIYAAVGTVARTSSGTASPGTTQDVVDLINAINAAIAQIPASDTNLKAAMAPTYSTSALYAVGDYAWYNGVLYKCITAITSGETWTSSHWTAANMGGDVSALKSAADQQTLSDTGSAYSELSNGYLIQGYLQSDGRRVSNSKRIGTGFLIPVKVGDTLYFKPGTVIDRMLIDKFTVARQWVSDFGYYTTEKRMYISEPGFISLIFKNSGETDITPAQFDATVIISPYERKEEEVQNKALEIADKYEVLIDGKEIEFERGTLDDQTGEEVVGTTQLRTADYLNVGHKRKAIIKPDNIDVWVFEYDDQKIYKGREKLTNAVTIRYYTPYIKLVVVAAEGRNTFSATPIYLREAESVLVMTDCDNKPLQSVDKFIPKCYAISYENGEYIFVTDRKGMMDYIPITSGSYIRLKNRTGQTCSFTLWYLDETKQISSYISGLTEKQADLFRVPDDISYIRISYGSQSGLLSADYDYPFELTQEGVYLIDFKMESGGLYSGKPTWSQEDHEKKARCAYTIQLNSATAIRFDRDNVIQDNEQYYVYFYDSNFTFITGSAVAVNKGRSVESIPSTAKYMKFMQENKTTGGSLTTKPTSVKIAFACDGEPPKEVKNGHYHTTTEWLTFDVKGSMYTFARMLLPPNYDPLGKPSPVVFYMDGSGNMINFAADFPPNKKPYLQYVADEGFAVVSIFGWGSEYFDKYANCGMAYPYPVPTCRACIKKGIEWLCDRFNLDANNIHIMSKSQGGQNATFYATHPDFPVKSIGMFAPVNDYFSMPGEDLYADTRKAISDDIGMTGEDLDYFRNAGYLGYTARAKALWQENITRAAGLNEAWTSLVGGTLQENFDKAFSDSYNFWEGHAWLTPERDDIYNNDDYIKMGKVPVKIWGASDDNQTPFFAMRQLVHQLQNGGTEAELRELARGTGGHSCADVDGNYVPSVTTALGITHTDVPIGWIENVAWARQHMAYDGSPGTVINET